jgi:hypothetical protein
MSERFIKNINDLTFQPFDNYGKPVERNELAQIKL